MKKNIKYSALHIGIITSLLVSSGAMAAGTWAESRQDAMGGSGVASANYGSGILINPALLATAEADDDISLILPSAGVQITDKDNLQDELDNISDNINQYSSYANLPPLQLLTKLPDFQKAAGDMAKDLEDLRGKSANAKAAAGIAISIPNAILPVAFVTKAYARARVSSYIDQNDIDTLNQISRSQLAAATAALNPEEVRDSLKSTGFGRAAIVNDYGVAVARQFDLGGVPVSIGVTPKLQRTWLYNYTVSVYNYNKDDFRDNRYRNIDSGFNVDAGLAAQLSDSWSLGLSGQNLLSRDIDTNEIGGYKDTYQIRPLVTAGVAWKNDLITLSADGDLTETKGFKSEDSSQYVGGGAEIRPLSWLAVRAGYRADIKNNDSNVVTAGLGFSPFNSVHIDVNGAVGEDDTWGAGAQLGFNF